MRFEDVYLAGVGSCLGAETTVAQAVEAGLYGAEAAQESGMTAVRIAGDRPAPDLAVAAARTALATAGLDDDDYGALIYATTHHQGPDGWSAPHYVLNRTLDRPVPAVEVRQGCLGMLAGLEMAAHRLIADPAHSAVLLAAADNFSTPLVNRWEASSLFLLSDGAAGAVVARGGGFARVVSYAAVSDPGMEGLHRGGEVLFPPGITTGRSLNFEERSQWWREQWRQGVPPPMGDLPGLVDASVEQALDEAGLDLGKVARVAHVAYSHAALRDLFLEPLGLEPERSLWEFTRTRGHSGAGDPFIGLEHLWRTGQVAPGEVVLLVGATPGMQVGCAVIEIVETAPPVEHTEEGS